MSIQNALGALSVPYRQSREGFFGEKTSTLNFCEEDYAMSYWCAEVCNTLTNILFLWLGCRGVKSAYKNSHPSIFIVAFLGYTVVGLGSSLFHATLKYPMQLIDELSMIYTTCFMCYATFAYSRSIAFSSLLGTSLAGLAWFITARYYQTKDPQFHQDAYTVLTIIVVFSNMFIMEYNVRPALRSRDQKRVPGSSVPAGDAIVKEMWLLVATGLSIFLGGYLIWHLDNVYCNEVRQWRHSLQLPWAIILEGHAWWHLMTGIGAYYYITWRIWIHRCLEGNEDKFRLCWPSLLGIPEVVAIEHLEKKKQ